MASLFEFESNSARVPQPFAFFAMAEGFVPTLSAKNAEKGGHPRADAPGQKIKGEKLLLLPFKWLTRNAGR